MGSCGTQRSVAASVAAFTAAKNAIAAEKEACPAIRLVTGTPSTMPAETPMKTFETAFGASSLRTDAAAVEKAIDTYAGCRKAGRARAASSTAKLSVSAETMLPAVNNPSASSMTVRRSVPENNSGITGAETATTSAKTPTVHPACGTVTPKVSAICGIIPTMPISVLMMPKTPKVRIATSLPGLYASRFFMVVPSYFRLFAKNSSSLSNGISPVRS